MAQTIRKKSVPRWRRRPEQRRTAILRAAFQWFATHGIDNVRLDDIARDAGISKGSIYRYFPNKDQLFEETVAFALDEMVEKSGAASGADATAEMKLRSMWALISGGEFLSLAKLVFGAGARHQSAVRLFQQRLESELLVKSNSETMRFAVSLFLGMGLLSIDSFQANDRVSRETDLLGDRAIQFLLAAQAAKSEADQADGY
jgi:AcrR family transcriptional regulator